VAAYPIITYDEGFAARSQIMRAFHRRQLVPDIVLSATDTDIMKTYVRTGLGIAIMAHIAYSRTLDKGLRSIDARHLFESSMVHIGFRNNAYLTHQMMQFIELFAPKLNRAENREAVMR
jgi:LysR family cys regulon transcriptional activator